MGWTSALCAKSEKVPLFTDAAENVRASELLSRATTQSKECTWQPGPSSHRRTLIPSLRRACSPARFCSKAARQDSGLATGLQGDSRFLL